MRFFSRKAAPAASHPGLTLGNVVSPGREQGIPFRLTSDDIRNAHLRVGGISGVGKSSFLVTLILQLFGMGIAFALVDPHLDLGHATVQQLADTGYFEHPSAFSRLKYFSFNPEFHPELVVPFDYLQQPYDPHTIAGNVLEVFKRNWSSMDSGAAPAFENTVLYGTLALVYNRRPLTDFLRFLSDEEFRASLVRNVPDEQAQLFYRRLEEQSRTNLESTARRLTLLTFSPVLRDSLGAATNALQFRQLMDSGTSVICDLGGLTEQEQRFLGSMIVVGFEQAALSRVDMPAERRNTYRLFIDEASMFMSGSGESFARILDLTRKYGLLLTLANQYNAQTGKVLESALQQCITVAFRLTQHDASSEAQFLTQYDPLKVKQAPGSTYVRPTYMSLSEQVQMTRMQLEDLPRQEALVKAGSRRARIRALTIPPGKTDIRPILERYNADTLVSAHNEPVAPEQDWPRRRGSDRGAS